MTVVDAYIRRMVLRFVIVPSQAVCCPRLVVGKRCLRFHGGPPCVCEPFWPRPLDHVYAWKGRGERFLTCEPYDLAPEVLADFRRAVQPLGVVVTVDPHPEWTPTTTRLVCHREGVAWPPSFHAAARTGSTWGGRGI
jgi:hypothetical protein